jgi:hypothetical protein
MMGRVRYVGFHVGHANEERMKSLGLFSARAG